MEEKLCNNTYIIDLEQELLVNLCNTYSFYATEVDILKK